LRRRSSTDRVEIWAGKSQIPAPPICHNGTNNFKKNMNNNQNPTKKEVSSLDLENKKREAAAY
jgi:hypothetical protein